MQQVHKSKNNQARKTKHKQGAAMGGCQMEWGGVGWGEHLLTRLACLFCKQRVRSNRKTEAKQRIRAVVRKAETNKKNRNNLECRKHRGSFQTYIPRSQLLSFDKAHFLQRSC